MKIYSAIAAVMGDLAHEGIAKDRKNQAQGFSFRGIDDVYNALAPLLAKHGLVILPRVLSRTASEHTNAKGSTLFYVVVDMEFDLVAAEDGSKHTVRTVGEAMDSGDKATNKAMSAAYKYAAFQTFCIPTEGDNDADAQTHTVVAGARASSARAAANPVQAAEWTSEVRTSFMGRLAQLGLDYPTLCAWMQRADAAEKVRPSQLPDERRTRLIGWLSGDGKDIVQSWGQEHEQEVHDEREAQKARSAERKGAK